MVIHFEHDGRNALHVFNSDPRSFKVLVRLQKRFLRIQLGHISNIEFCKYLSRIRIRQSFYTKPRDLTFGMNIFIGVSKTKYFNKENFVNQRIYD